MCLITGILKCILGIINGLIMTLGIMCLGVGAVLLWGVNSVLPQMMKISSHLKEFLKNLGSKNAEEAITAIEQMIHANSSTIGAVIFIIGCILTIVAIIGYVALCCVGLKCLLYVLILILSILFVGLTTIAIMYGASGQEKIFVHIEDGLWQLMGKYKSFNATNPESLLINVVQSQFHCCGIYNYTDYEKATNWINKGIQKFPATCCHSERLVYKDVKSCLKNQESPFMDIGCYSKAKPFLDKYLGYIFAGLGIIIAVLGVLDALFIWAAYGNYGSK